MQEYPPLPGWAPQAYLDATDGVCALLAAVQDLDQALGTPPVKGPESVLCHVARVRQALDFIEMSARYAP
jgi:hypothetical protein